jgi:ribosomal-protein-alanine N-acetyltransferase
MQLNQDGYQPSQNGPPQSLRLSFREAAADDMPRIMDIFTKGFKGQVPQETLPAYEATFARHMDSPTHQFNVAVLNGRIAGFTDLSTIKPDYTYLEVIGVDPAEQGSGIGKALMQDAEKTTARLGREQLAFHVREDNISGRKFYDKLGYAVRGIEKGFYDWDGVDALVMSKFVAQQQAPRR